MPVPLKVLDQQINFFPGFFNLFGCAAEFYLGAPAQYFQQREFFLKDIEFTVVYAKKFNGVNGFKVDDSFCQCVSILTAVHLQMNLQGWVILKLCGAFRASVSNISFEILHTRIYLLTFTIITWKS